MATTKVPSSNAARTAPAAGSAEASDDAAKRAALAAGAQAGVKGAQAYQDAQAQIKASNAASMQTLMNYGNSFGASGTDPMFANSINRATQSRLGAVQAQAADFSAINQIRQQSLGAYMDSAKSALDVTRVEARRSSGGGGGGGGSKSGGPTDRQLGLAALRAIAQGRDSDIRNLLSEAARSVATGKKSQFVADANSGGRWDPVWQATLLNRAAAAAGKGDFATIGHNADYQRVLEGAFWQAHPRLKAYQDAAAKDPSVDPKQFGLTAKDVQRYTSGDGLDAYKQSWEHGNARKLGQQAVWTRADTALDAYRKANPAVGKLYDYVNSATKAAAKSGGGKGYDVGQVERLGKAAGLTRGTAMHLAEAAAQQAGLRNVTEQRKGPGFLDKYGPGAMIDRFFYPESVGPGDTITRPGVDLRSAGRSKLRDFAMQWYLQNVRAPETAAHGKVAKEAQTAAAKAFADAAAKVQGAQTEGTMPFGDYAVQMGEQLGLPADAMYALNDPTLQNMVEKQMMAGLPPQTKPMSQPSTLSDADLAKLGISPAEAQQLQGAQIPLHASLSWQTKDGKPVSEADLNRYGVANPTDPNDPNAKAAGLTYLKGADGQPIRTSNDVNALNYYLGKAAAARKGIGGIPQTFEQFLSQLRGDPNFRPAKGSKQSLLSPSALAYIAALAKGYWNDYGYQPMSQPQWYFQNTYGNMVPQIPAG